MSLPDQKIHVSLMLEVLGTPPEHLVETLNELINKMGSEKGVKIKNKEIHEPVELEGNEGFYTTFADIEVEVESLREIITLTFRYMPSHIDIISPENLRLENNYFNEVFNEITRRLHAYDEVARILQNEMQILKKKLDDSADKKLPK